MRPSIGRMPGQPERSLNFLTKRCGFPGSDCACHSQEPAEPIEIPRVSRPSPGTLTRFFSYPKTAPVFLPGPLAFYTDLMAHHTLREPPLPAQSITHGGAEQAGNLVNHWVQFEPGPELADPQLRSSLCTLFASLRSVQWIRAALPAGEPLVSFERSLRFQSVPFPVTVNPKSLDGGLLAQRYYNVNGPEQG